MPSSSEVFATRRHQLEEEMRREQVAVVLLGPGSDLRALTGYHATALERMTLLVVRVGGDAVLIVPELERLAAEANATGVVVRDYGETSDPAALVATAVGQVAPSDRIAVGDQLWSRFLLDIQQVVGPATWSRASGLTRAVRMVKDTEGLDGLRAAGAAIDDVHRQIPQLLSAGMTERELGRKIDRAMRESGHDGVDFVIVASGPNGASPHHETSERVLRPGEGVVIDIGGPVRGWFSDCTRNYCPGEPSRDYLDAFEVLQRAQRDAVAHVRPGVTAESVDAVARQVITEAGYGEAFIHRTGHGIGMEVHEEPYIMPGNDLVLTEGMTFSIEPGIYLSGRFGMRIEDIVAVTETGVERLNTTSTDLVRV